MRFGFEGLGLERVQAITREDNIRSIRSVQKLGFVKEAVLEDARRRSESGLERRASKEKVTRKVWGD